MDVKTAMGLSGRDESIVWHGKRPRYGWKVVGVHIGPSAVLENHRGEQVTVALEALERKTW